MTGDAMTAQRAYEIGLANRLAPKGQGMAVALEVATKIARNAPLAIQAMKSISRSVLPKSFAPIRTKAWRPFGRSVTEVRRALKARTSIPLASKVVLCNLCRWFMNDRASSDQGRAVLGCFEITGTLRARKASNQKEASMWKEHRYILGALRWSGSLLRGLILAVASLMLIVGTSHAQEAFPNSPIRMVVPFPPGGSSDNVGRIVADRMGRQLNGTIIIENRPGATTQVGTEVVAQAKPDGYTLLLGASTTFTVLPNLRKLNFSIDNFEVIGGVATYVSILAVNNALPVKSLDEFIKYARANPGKLSFGSAGEASFGNIAGGALARHMNLDFLHVPFRGSADAVTNAVAGHVDFVIDGAAVPLVKGGQLRPLVTFAQRRHPELPDLPSLKDFNIDIELAHSAGWSVLVPKGTPKPIVDKLSQALEKVLADPEVSQQFHKANAISSWQPSPVFLRSVELDRKFYSELLPAIGIKKDN